jgi:methylenetetrahydrofolate dehydrogenase (NADP+)/methenyltetrahydrofolate cyclohydrolase
MAATLIDGKAVAAELKSRIAQQVRDLAGQGKTPFLVAVQAGQDPAAEMYAGMQRRNCQAAGIRYELQNLPGEIPESQLLAHISMLNTAPEVTGILLQMPLPDHIDARKAQLAISQDKDVEGIHPAQMGKLFYGEAEVAPCTALASIELLRRACNDWAGKEAVIIGHSEILGKPLATMLLGSRRSAPTVTVCHIATDHLADHVARADILIVGAGVAQARWRVWQRRAESQPAEPPDLRPLVSKEMVKPGAVVIDVAINRIPRDLDADGYPQPDASGKIPMQTVGDVDPQAARVASAITPVPGGVGPVTVAMLLGNILVLARRNLR